MFLMLPRLRLNKCIFESNPSEIPGVHSLGGRRWSDFFLPLPSATLLWPPEGAPRASHCIPQRMSPFSILKWLRYSGNLWERRGSRFHELGASTGVCFPAWPNSPNSWRILYQSSETSSGWGRCRCQLARGHLWD